MVLPGLVVEWRDEGKAVSLAGHEIFVVDRGPHDAPTLVLLHGFPGSSFDWRRVIDQLASGWRVITLDFLGFGLSAKPSDAGYLLFEQADLVEELLVTHEVTDAVLVAHDMGDTVAAELLARANESTGRVRWLGCVLTNGSIFIEMAQLTAGQQMLLGLPDEPLEQSLGAEALLGGLQASFPEGRPDPTELDAMVALVCHTDGDLLLPRLIRYVEQRRRHQPRWTAGLRDFAGPVVAAWGDLDPIAVPTMADHLGALRAAAGREVEVVHWPDVGHWPSIEAPELVAGLIVDEVASW